MLCKVGDQFGRPLVFHFRDIASQQGGPIRARQSGHRERKINDFGAYCRRNVHAPLQSPPMTSCVVCSSKNASADIQVGDLESSGSYFSPFCLSSLMMFLPVLFSSNNPLRRLFWILKGHPSTLR